MIRFLYNRQFCRKQIKFYTMSQVGTKVSNEVKTEINIDVIRAQIKALQNQLPKKIISAEDISAKNELNELIKLINGDLLTVNKVQLAALKVLRLFDNEQSVLSLLTTSQKEKFNYGQWCLLVKSHAMVLRVNQSKLVSTDTITVSQYIGMIRKGSCLTAKTFDLRKKVSKK